MIRTIKNPELRFPEFVGDADYDWQVKRLGDICLKGSSNLTMKDVHRNAQYYVYGASGICGKTNDFISDEKYIAIVKDGAGVGTLYLCETHTHILATLQKITHKENQNLLYIYYMMRKINFDKYIMGSTIPHIYYRDYSKEKIYLPCPDEQQKIAGFLSAIDRRLVLLQAKYDRLMDYKRGIMQQIFTQKIRFKKPNGTDYPKWQQNRLGDVLSYEQPTKYIVESTEYNDSYKTPVLTAGKSFILGYTNETKGIYQNAECIIFDDFTTASKYVNFHFKVKSSAMKILTQKNQDNSLKVIHELLQLVYYPTYDHKRYWISEFEDLTINLPHPDEQKHIAGFLSAIDYKIDTLNTQIIQTKQYKKSLMQRMFV